MTMAKLINVDGVSISRPRQIGVRIGVTIALALAAQAPVNPAAASRPAHTPNSAVVVTRSGAVRGSVAAGYRSFLGIPYAAPPVAERRWTSPQPVAPWPGVRDATRPGGDCPQLAGSVNQLPSENEDCLYLNVTTPTRATSRRMPVMVWIHGGAFSSGAGRVYQANHLVEAGNVIVVTINYRLGVFGFLAHPSLDGESPRSTSGAYGIEDQQAALRWVSENAAAFGGDPGKVTIFGESAGGMSTCAHLVAPGSAGLFHRAIIESGPCQFLIPPNGSWTRPIAQAERLGLATAHQLGCDDEPNVAACLRATAVPELLATGGSGLDFNYWPAHGGSVLPVEPVAALAAGRVNRVPVIQGTNRDEYRLFVAIMEQLAGHPVTADEYRATVDAGFGARAERILAEYELTNFDSPSLALSQVFTDATWSCQARQTDILLAGQMPTWSYEFSDRRAPWLGSLPTPNFPPGAYHGAELQYLFSVLFSPNALDDDQRRLSEQMIGYWTRFAHSGNPNGAAATSWPPFTPGNQWTRRLAPAEAGTPRVDLGSEHRCAFWDGLL